MGEGREYEKDNEDSFRADTSSEYALKDAPKNPFRGAKFKIDDNGFQNLSKSIRFLHFSPRNLTSRQPQKKDLPRKWSVGCDWSHNLKFQMCKNDTSFSSISSWTAGDILSNKGKGERVINCLFPLRIWRPWKAPLPIPICPRNKPDGKIVFSVNVTAIRSPSNRRPSTNDLDLRLQKQSHGKTLSQRRV